MVATSPELIERTELPAKQASRFGLKSVTDARQTGNRLQFGLAWQDSCGANVFVAPDNCDDTLTQEERTKTTFGLDDGEAFDPFALYAFHSCNIIGLPLSTRQAYATEELDLGEWYQLERRFAETITAGTSFAVGGISGAKNALGAALMEWDFPVEPTVHVTHNVAVALEGLYARHGNHLELHTGEKLSVGYGYDVDLADATEGWIILTGPTFVKFGTTIMAEAPNPLANQYGALAERPYVMGHLCSAVFVKVNDVVAITA